MKVGIDIGGTKVSIGLIEDVRIIGQAQRFLISDCHSGEDLVSRIKIEIDQLIIQNHIDWSKITGIGVGTPGPLNFKTGIILRPPNLPMLWNYPLRSALLERTGIGTAVNNDANCFALGEQKAGEGRGLEYVLGITIGTGFGAGFVYYGTIYNGATGTGLEFGQTPYREGVLEDYISGRGIAAIYAGITNNSRPGREISRMAEDGDRDALQAWRIFGDHLAYALIILTNVLDPDCIVIGGSGAAGFPHFRKSLEERFRKGVHEQPRRHVLIKCSRLGEEAAIIGAACLRDGPGL